MVFFTDRFEHSFWHPTQDEETINCQRNLACVTLFWSTKTLAKPRPMRLSRATLGTVMIITGPEKGERAANTVRALKSNVGALRLLAL